jgi:hypothetical protein
MRQIFIILFVFIFTLAGKSQEQRISKPHGYGNSAIISDFGSMGHYAVIFEDNLIANQDSNDLDGFDNISVLPDTHVNFNQVEIGRVPETTVKIQSTLFCELLLDLPPPVISI